MALSLGKWGRRNGCPLQADRLEMLVEGATVARQTGSRKIGFNFTDHQCRREAEEPGNSTLDDFHPFDRIQSSEYI